DWVKSSADYRTSDLVATSDPARGWWDAQAQEAAGSDAMIRDPRPGSPAFHAVWSGDREQASGFLFGYDSIWLPVALLQANERERLAGALSAASRHWEVQLHFNKGLAGAPSEAIAAARETATNPAVLDAFALAIVANGGPPLPWLPLFADFGRRRARAVD